MVFAGIVLCPRMANPVGQMVMRPIDQTLKCSIRIMTGSHCGLSFQVLLDLDGDDDEEDDDDDVVNYNNDDDDDDSEFM